MFLNACRTDGQAPLYTTVEGWAASFLRAGAGAFIGSLWEVVDTSASTYAQQFYQAALAGHTLGESARQARDAIRDNPGDPTWLAYTLYGDPAATVSTGSRPDRLSLPWASGDVRKVQTPGASTLRSNSS